MARIRLIAVMAIALVAGGALAFGTYNYMKHVPVKTVSIPTRPVVIARADLELGTELRTDDVRVVDYPAGSAPEGAFGRSADVAGRGLLMAVVKDEPILPGKLAPKEAGAGLPPVIPQGMRAVSVRVNEVIGVAGYVLPGTRVDVVATATPDERKENTTSKVVLTNVQVLAAGTRLEQDKDKGKPIQVTVVTLLVSPEQSEKLALASTEGKIQLALRNPLDTTAPDTPGIRPAMLLGAAPAQRTAQRSRTASAGPASALAPAPLPTVEIIRGDKRANEVVR